MSDDATVLMAFWLVIIFGLSAAWFVWCCWRLACAWYQEIENGWDD